MYVLKLPYMFPHTAVYVSSGAATGFGAPTQAAFGSFAGNTGGAFGAHILL
jgi:hypothetical protein